MKPIWNHIPPPPDLLRRFVATPHTAAWQIDGTLALVQTNDETVLKAFPSEGLEGCDGMPRLRLKVIVDPELQISPQAAPVRIETPEMLLGRSERFFFSFDRKSRELDIFTNEGPVSELREFVLQILHSEDATASA